MIGDGEMRRVLTATGLAAMRHPHQFRYESDLVEVLRPALSSALFSGSVQNDVEVFSEIPAVHGIPDLAAIRFDWDVVRRRFDLGIKPLSSDAEVRVVLALSRRKLAVPELAASVGMSAGYIRRTLVPYLHQLGWIRITPSGLVEKVAEARNVGVRVVTVEAKLRNWRGALNQARRQRYSANDAYIALEASSMVPLREDIPHISAQGIGVISVDADTSRVSVLARPTSPLRSAETVVGRMLISERCLDMWSRGERQGQIYPVFGWSRPPLDA